MTRQPDDYYSTPPWATEALLKKLGKPPSHILEPAAGTGAIMRVIKAHWPTAVLHGYELDQGRQERCTASGLWVSHANYLEATDIDGADLIITNPPYSLALEFAHKCLRDAREVCLLLRLGFLASKERAEFHRAHPCDVYVLDKRPSFCRSYSCTRKGDGCAWRATLELDAESIRECPWCGARVNVSSTDASDYGWFCWGPGRGGKWEVLS